MYMCYMMDNMCVYIYIYMFNDLSLSLYIYIYIYIPIQDMRASGALRLALHQSTPSPKGRPRENMVGADMVLA